jgi:hypothetical protein
VKREGLTRTNENDRRLAKPLRSSGVTDEPGLKIVQYGEPHRIELIRRRFAFHSIFVSRLIRAAGTAHSSPPWWAPWWAHLELTRRNIEPTLRRKDFEEQLELLEVARFSGQFSSAVRQVEVYASVTDGDGRTIDECATGQLAVAISGRR